MKTTITIVTAIWAAAVSYDLAGHCYSLPWFFVPVSMLLPACLLGDKFINSED